MSNVFTVGDDRGQLIADRQVQFFPVHYLKFLLNHFETICGWILFITFPRRIWGAREYVKFRPAIINFKFAAFDTDRAKASWLTASIMILVKYNILNENRFTSNHYWWVNPLLLVFGDKTFYNYFGLLQLSRYFKRSLETAPNIE